jgi:hypothetical protein
MNLTLSFDDARAILEQKHQVDFHFAEHVLSNIDKVMQVYIAYQQIFPEDHKARLEKLLPARLAELRNKNTDLVFKCVEAVGNLFPINEAMLEEIEQYIWIEPQSPSMSWEEFDALLEDENADPNDYYFSSQLSFCMLVWCIGNSINRETWERLDAMFGWGGIPWPERMIKTNRNFNSKLLQKNLKRAGLEDFMTSIKIAWRSTDNYFFDFDENYSYEEQDTPTFDARCICKLYHEWQAAKPIAESNQRAELMLLQDPSILQKVVDIMGKSLEKPRKPKTLVEVFAEQENQP